MIIWGWRSRMKTLSEGMFFSPAAGRDVPYKLIEARRWFTLFFIPLIPLKVLGTYVECSQTGSTYDPKILNNPTNADFTDQLSAAVREVVVAVAQADGQITAEEQRLAIETIGRTVPGYNSTDFEQDLARSVDATLDARLLYLSGSLNERGKEQLLTAAATIMTADGSIDERDRKAVQDIGGKLTMTQAHVKGVIATAESHLHA